MGTLRLSRSQASAMAVPLSAGRRPGSRLIVQYPDPVDPGWAHERLVLWPCAGDVNGVSTSIVLTPDGDVYEEAESDWARAEVFTSDYPAWANDFNIRQFDEPVERAELILHINIARRAVHRVLAGRQKAPDVSELVDWSGAAYPLPRLGVLARGRDAFVRHRPVVRAPTRRFSRKAPDPEPRRDPPPGAGTGLIDFSHAESPERRPPGRLLGPGEGGSGEVPDCAWMRIYPHTGRSDIGKTVVPGVGSFLGTGGLGSF